MGQSALNRRQWSSPSVLLLAALLYIVGVNPASARDTREVPIPTTVSPELQAILKMGNIARTPPPLPTTNEGWFLRRGEPALQHQHIQDLLSRFDVSMTSRVIAGVACYVLTPAKIAVSDKHKLLVHVHGGAYVSNAGESGTQEAILMASAIGIPVVSIDYRMPPDHPFPAAIDDSMAVWKALIKEHRPADMAIFGTSTGGALTLSMIQRARAERLPLPAAIIAATPWSDLSKTGDSYFINELTAVPFYDGFLSATAKLYANGLDLKDPRVSPVYGEFSGFPPTMLISGTRDLFLSNTVRVQRKLLDAGVPTHLIVYEGQFHAIYLEPTIPESAQAFGDMARFLRRYVGAEILVQLAK